MLGAEDRKDWDETVAAVSEIIKPEREYRKYSHFPIRLESILALSRHVAELEGALCKAHEAINPMASMIQYFRMLWNGRAYRGSVPPLHADAAKFDNAKEASDAKMVLAMEEKTNAALNAYNAALSSSAPCPHESELARLKGAVIPAEELAKVIEAACMEWSAYVDVNHSERDMWVAQAILTKFEVRRRD